MFGFGNSEQKDKEEKYKKVFEALVVTLKDFALIIDTQTVTILELDRRVREMELAGHKSSRN